MSGLPMFLALDLQLTYNAATALLSDADIVTLGLISMLQLHER